MMDMISAYKEGLADMLGISKKAKDAKREKAELKAKLRQDYYSKKHSLQIAMVLEDFFSKNKRDPSPSELIKILDKKGIWFGDDTNRENDAEYWIRGGV